MIILLEFLKLVYTDYSTNIFQWKTFSLFLYKKTPANLAGVSLNADLMRFYLNIPKLEITIAPTTIKIVPITIIPI
jgi:hypothetical protein